MIRAKKRPAEKIAEAATVKRRPLWFQRSHSAGFWFWPRDPSCGGWVEPERTCLSRAGAACYLADYGIPEESIRALVAARPGELIVLHVPIKS